MPLNLDSPLVAAVVTGSYLAAFYITNNITMLPASSILVVAICLITPIVLATGLLTSLMKRISLNRYIPMATIFLCTVYLLLVLRTPILEISIIQNNLNLQGDTASTLSKFSYFLPVLLLASIFAFMFRRYVRIYSIALSVMLMAAIIPVAQALVTELAGDNSLTTGESQSDIPSVSLSLKPNIYFILADSYGSFTHLDKIGIPSDGFRSWLTKSGFSVYEDAYSNYQPTTAAMPAMLNMKHHYYALSKKFSEISRSGRVVTGGKNALVRFLRKNGYEIQYIHQGEYLLLHGCLPIIVFQRHH